MSTIELQKKLIEKIKKTESEDLLAEAYRLLERETIDIETFTFNSDQKQNIAEAREQIKRGEYLPNSEANKEINEWLKK